MPSFSRCASSVSMAPALPPEDQAEMRLAGVSRCGWPHCAGDPPDSQSDATLLLRAHPNGGSSAPRLARNRRRT
jgi:hypothetical protein